MRILTGIDLPFAPLCGSVILCNDLYGGVLKKDKVRFLGFNSTVGKKWSKIGDVHLMNIKKRQVKKFDQYVEELYDQIKFHVNDFKPDVIHIQHLSFGMAMAFSRFNIPKIALCHGTAVEFAINSSFHRHNVRKIVKASDMLVFPSDRMYQDYRKYFPIRKNKAVIPWGIPDKLCSSAKPRKNWSTNKFQILYAGRLSANKGVDTIVKSLTLLDERVKLTIIGSGEQLIKLKNLTKRCFLCGRVKFIAFQKREKLWKSFKRFDALIVSTRLVEAFCLTAVEAQAHGLPVIYSNIGGTRNVIGKSGIMFKADDYRDLAKKINKLVFNTQSLNKYSKLGVQNARKYKISDTRKKLIKITRSIISKHEK